MNDGVDKAPGRIITFPVLSDDLEKQQVKIIGD